MFGGVDDEIYYFDVYFWGQEFGCFEFDGDVCSIV